MTHRFVTSCIDAVGEDINEMKDILLKKDLSTANFINKIAPRLGIDKELVEMLGFETKKEFANDWALRCASSFYQGIPCYYVQWSAIEYVFVDEDDFDKVLDVDAANARQSRIYDLTEAVEEVIHDRKPASDKAIFGIAAEFELANRATLNEFRIPMSSLAQYRCDHAKAFEVFDKKNYGKDQESSHKIDLDTDSLGFN